VRVAFETAYQAADMLRHTGDQDLAREACDLAEKAEKEIQALEATIATSSQAHPCSRCGYRNPPASLFCGRCGASLQVFADATTTQLRGIVCHVCHHENAPGHKFCAQCGSPLG